LKATDYIRCTADGKIKRQGKLIKGILITALVLYIPVCSLSDSVNEGAKKVFSSLSGRILVFQDESDGFSKEIVEYLQGDIRVLGVYPYVNQIAMQAENFIEAKGFITGSVQSYSECMEEYVCKGKKQDLAENEILIPKYLYGYGGEKRYADGDLYIGKTIELVFYNKILKEEKRENYTIAGTYDNIYGMTAEMNFLANPEKAVELYEFINDGAELEKQMLMEESGNRDESLYVGFENTYYHAIFLADRNYYKDILEELKDKFGMSGTVLISETNNSIDKIFHAVRVVCSLLSMLLFIILTVVIVLATVYDMQERKWEFALKLAFGYRKEQLVLITFLEYISLALKAYAVTMILSFLFNIVGNYVIENFLPEELLCIHLDISGYIAVSGFLITVFMAAVSVPVCIGRIKNIKIGEVLKAEK